MSDNISPKEWETMSAYLDGQLGRKEQERLERSFDQSPALYEALEGLRQTRALLRSQPRLRAMRNFTLTPELAGLQGERSKSGFAMPFLRLVSVLASILFVFIFAGDLIASRSSDSNVTMLSASEQESISIEKAAPQLAMPEEALEEIETVQSEPSTAFEMEQGVSAPDYELEVPARKQETVPQGANGYDDLGGDVVFPETAKPPVLDEPNPLKNFFTHNSALRFLEVLLIFIAVTAGVMVIYLNRRNQV